MNYLMYLLIPLVLSALLTPILKVVATRLEIYAVEMKERYIAERLPVLEALQFTYLLLSAWRCL